jgi:transcriptional regulator with XRE-family HTH domain
MQNIGERLEEARKKKGISLREAAEATKIRGEYLHLFETNKFDLGLTDIYVRGFLRTYALYLKLPADRIVGDYTARHRSDQPARAINPEVYGRVDLPPASSGAASEEDRPAAAAAVAPARPPSKSTGSRPPMRAASNYSPRSAPVGGGATWDRGVILKLGGLAAGLVVVIFGLTYLLSSHKPAPADKPVADLTASTTTNSDPQTMAPTANGPKLKITANGRVHVTLRRSSNNAILLDEDLAAGVSREVERNEVLHVSATPRQNVQFDMQNGVTPPFGMQRDFTPDKPDGDIPFPWPLPK